MSQQKPKIMTIAVDLSRMDDYRRKGTKIFSSAYVQSRRGVPARRRSVIITPSAFHDAASRVCTFIMIILRALVWVRV